MQWQRIHCVLVSRDLFCFIHIRLNENMTIYIQGMSLSKHIQVYIFSVITKCFSLNCWQLYSVCEMFPWLYFLFRQFWLNQNANTCKNPTTRYNFSTQKSVNLVLKNKLKFEGGGLQNRGKKKGIKLIASMQRSGFCA